MAGNSIILPAVDVAESGGTPTGGMMGCAFDSLVRPNFYAGQLLTDDDLTALVTWSAERGRLARFRHGWGVVAGLDIRPDPNNPAQVLLSPGYAIGRSGDDIVVCREASCDIIAARSGDPQPSAPAPEGKGQGKGHARSLDFFSCPVPAHEVYIFDLFLVFDQQADALQVPLGVAAGGRDGPAQQPTRIRETYKLVTQPHVPESDGAPHPADVWQEEFDACGAVVGEYERAFPGGPGEESGRGAAARRWLVGWIARHPLQHFPALVDCLKAKEARDFDEKLIAETLFWLVQDRRTTLLTRACQVCEPDEGVRLARIWLHGTGPDNRRAYRVLSIAPYRRVLGPEGWPARTGRINLAQFLWRPYDEAYGRMLDEHLRLGETEEFELPDSLVDLHDWLSTEVIVERRVTEVHPQIYSIGHDHHARMIVGFGLNREEEDHE